MQIQYTMFIDKSFGYLSFESCASSFANLRKTNTVALPSFTMTIKWRGRGSEIARDCDEKTALRKTWKEWEKNGEQEQKTEGLAC